MSSVSSNEEKFVAVLDEPIKVYDYQSGKECVRNWRVNQYPLNEFILSCRNDGEKDIAYFNLRITGPLIFRMSIKITKDCFDPTIGTKKPGYTETEELGIDFKRAFNWKFSRVRSAYKENSNGIPVRIFPFWIKVEYSTPRTPRSILNGYNISANYTTCIPDFFNKPEFGDFQIKVGDQVFHVSKLALAVASPAFETMFASNLSETKDNSMEIKDFSPAVVEKLLKFVYDTEIPILENMEQAEQLVAIADKYQIEHLKDRAEQIILNQLIIEDAARLVVFADMHRCSQLRQACINLICSDYPAFIQSKECEKLYKNFTKLAIEISGAAAQDKTKASD